jgi:hypothetical protein
MILEETIRSSTYDFYSSWGKVIRRGRNGWLKIDVCTYKTVVHKKCKSYYKQKISALEEPEMQALIYCNKRGIGKGLKT